MRKTLVYLEDGTPEWVEVGYGPKGTTKKEINNCQGEDLTVDGYISKYGGIKSNIDEKVYTTKSSYMNHVKANGCVIKDW